jgi:hypothetical protein
VKLGFDLPDAGATLTVYDLSGGRVRVESLSAAVHEWTWNLTDAAGRRVKPGLYVIELRSGAIKRVRRLVVL